MALILSVNRALAACLFLLAPLLGIKAEQSCKLPASFPTTAKRFQASVKADNQASVESANEDQVSAVCNQVSDMLRKVGNGRYEPWKS